MWRTLLPVLAFYGVVTGVSATLSGRSEALALFKRDVDVNGVCQAGYFACATEFGGCCLVGRRCTINDCLPGLEGMINTGGIDSVGHINAVAPKLVHDEVKRSAVADEGGFIEYNNNNLPDPNYGLNQDRPRTFVRVSVLGIVLASLSVVFLFLLAILVVLSSRRRRVATVSKSGVVVKKPAPRAKGSKTGAFGGMFAKKAKSGVVRGEKGSGNESAHLHQIDTTYHNGSDQHSEYADINVNTPDDSYKGSGLDYVKISQPEDSYHR